jgi:hypothetical protein
MYNTVQTIKEKWERGGNDSKHYLKPKQIQIRLCRPYTKKVRKNTYFRIDSQKNQLQVCLLPCAKRFMNTGSGQIAPTALSHEQPLYLASLWYKMCTSMSSMNSLVALVSPLGRGVYTARETHVPVIANRMKISNHFASVICTK